MEYNLLGDSVQIKEINETIKQVAPTNISVLITGESGTGKEVTANALHLLSRRADKPFIIVNCGAIPEGIIESELFGHNKGAFTGAIETRAGYFEMADKGTIFLDEIGDMPLSTQVKILRVLESGEFMKVGGSKYVSVDVRVIAATNRNLERDVANKSFREDLFFRLKSINIHIPPLRERKSDVKVLFNHFISSFSRKNKIEFAGIDNDAMEYIINYSWNGNARELRNFCESIIVLIPDRQLNIVDVKKNLSREVPDYRHLPALQFQAKEPTEKDILLRALFELKTDIMDIKHILNKREIEDINSSFIAEDDFVLKRNDIERMTQDEIDKEILKYLLKINKWNIIRIAEILGQTTRNIYRRIRKFKLSKRELNEY
jgi:DNA-binding NtrC family response regulator